MDLRSFSSSSPKARLAHTHSREGIQTGTTPYVTLSYCWGSKDFEFYKTTRANLDQGGRELPHDDLPRTFRDAFVIAKGLGVDYIWIDALCIIQDSIKDWNIESAKMPYIYSQALFCISADSSTNADGGCFNDDRSFDEWTEDPQVIHSSLSDARESTLFVYQAFITRRMPMTVRNAPITGRGWTFQERILSPRILHFTTEQVFWECREEYLAQDDTLTWLTKEESSSSSQTLSGLVKYNRQVPPSLIRDWYLNIAKQSSRRTLTYAKDKLPAISGIATAYHGALRCSYIAGTWTYKLGYGLCWLQYYSHSAKPFQAHRRNSFSWVSADGPLSWPSRPMDDPEESEFPFRLKTWNAPLINEHDPFGETGPCSLTVTGLLKKCRLSYEDCGAGHPGLFITGDTRDGVLQLGVPDLDSNELEKEQDVFCLPITSCVALYALVLSRLPTQDGDEKPKYSRIGLLKMSRERRKMQGKSLPLCDHCSRQASRGVEQWETVDDMSAWFGECEMQEIVLV